ncbi:MAG: glycosyl transferase [Pirellulaceae bacterium]|nr:MAG: glycosyl transferase [Pirellulaceae bacterium]GIW93419.1 MAG: glycosyl transferase [Pirellulaceae bacterium]
MCDAAPSQACLLPSPGISIIIPVFNRAQDLAVALAAIIRQAEQFSNVEILICDDGSTDDIGSTIEQFMASHGAIVRYMRQLHGGAASARNLGIAHARGELLLFTDSDCEPLEGWLETIVAEFQDQRIGLVGGAIEGRQSRYLSGQCLNFLMSSSLGAAGARNPRAMLHMKYYPRAGNMAVRAELARRAGGFPLAAFGEDLAFGRQIELLGAEIRYCPGAKVVHHERRSLQQAFIQAAGKGAARVRLARRHGQHQWLHVLPALLYLYLLALPFIMGVLGWASTLWLVPALIYAVSLLLLGAQGARALKRPSAFPAVIAYALALHLGYGLGYMIELCRTMAVNSGSLFKPLLLRCPTSTANPNTSRKPSHM